MPYNLRIRVEAENDLQDAYSYFEQCRKGLGADFMLCIEESLAKITRNPQHYPVVHKSIHRILVHRFPYSVFYQIHQQTIVVLAVMHCAREPKNWNARI